ncbi:MAG: hypothetical protein HGA96_12485 [Desulfobulbaceae bacterium]|nr:hypothetical protein [Desulfobulbaceae bacterium]
MKKRYLASLAFGMMTLGMAGTSAAISNTDFSSLKAAITDSSLVGEWVCTKYRVGNPPELAFLIPPYYQMSRNELFLFTEDLHLTITRDSDGNLTWDSYPRNAFASISVVNETRYPDECAVSGSLESFQGSYAVTVPNCLSDLNGWGPPMEKLGITVDKTSNNSIKLQSDRATLSCVKLPKKKGRH